MRRLFQRSKRDRTEVKTPVAISDRTNGQEKRQATDERATTGANGLGIIYSEPRPRQVAFAADDARSIASEHDGGICFPRPSQNASTLPSPSLPVAPTRKPSEQQSLMLPTVGPSGTLRATTPSSHPFPSYERPHSSLSHRASTAMSTHSGPMVDSPAGRSMSRLASAHGGYLRSDSRSNSGGQLQLPMTWSSMTEEDLVSNLGTRERTRQEVLWEIVASEERYAQELHSLRDHYVDPLLHPFRSPPLSPVMSRDAEGSETANTSIDGALPIASRFARLEPSFSNDSSISHRVFGGLESPALPDISGEDSAFVHSQDTMGSLGLARSIGFSSTRTRSHPASSSPALSSTPAKFRHHLKSSNPAPSKLHRSKDEKPPSQPPAMPHDLRILLEVIGDHLVASHEALSLRLRERYTEQYPLVRSLADVFAEADWLVQHYATFVLHLGPALASVEAALATVKAKKTPSPEMRRLARQIMSLEEKAAMDGESSLAICLSKPFQRLTKYPLLFLTLFHHTDPSTAEFAATEAMTIRIDEILRSIENEKIDAEHRMATRDVFARIEGITDRGLMLPNSERVLIDESAVWQPPEARRSVSDAGRQAGLNLDSARSRTKKNARRASDYVTGASKTSEPSLGSKRDIWRVRFSDVTILCQRSGVTDVPIGASLEEVKGKRRLPGPRRNLYRFQRIEHWEMKPLPAPPSRSMSTDDVNIAGTDEEPETPDSDGESRMSFNYEGDGEIFTPSALSRSLASTSMASASRSASRHKSDTVNSKFDRSGAASRVRAAPSPSPGSRARSPVPIASRRRFDQPTASSLARSAHTTVERAQTPEPSRARTRSALSPPSSPSSRRRTASAQSTPDASPAAAPRMVRDNSSRLLDPNSVDTYATFWQAQESQSRRTTSSRQIAQDSL